MTFQSAFLVRCTLSASPDPDPVRAYYVQHVQSGAEFRSTRLAEVNRWMADWNRQYLVQMLSAPGETAEGGQEDLQ